MDITTLTGPQLVAEYNRLAGILGLDTVNRFADRKVGVRRVQALQAQLPEEQEEAEETIRAFYPLQGNAFHARNNKKHGRTKLQLQNAVFQALYKQREGAIITEEDGSQWQEVYLDAAKIEGMHVLIWAGHLRGLGMKGRYRKLKGRKGAYGLLMVG